MKKIIPLLAVIIMVAACKKTAVISDVAADNNSAATLKTDNTEATSVRIGTQVWKTKNLNVTHYRNGDSIPQVKDAGKWSTVNRGAWCWFNNDSATGAVYGKLYNWYAVNDSRGLAPTGWHVSTYAEWDTLSMHLGNNAGGKLKDTGTIEAGTGLWYAPNTGATNRSGFTALPGGIRDNNGSFRSIGTNGYWWSSTELYFNTAWYRWLYYNTGDIYGNFYGKRYGLSVRCVKD